MRVRSSLWMGLAMLGMQLAVPTAMAEGKQTGILTDRLSAKQLKIWKSIVNTVNAQDDAGRPLYPKLRGLWQRIASGTHAVHIEIFTPTNISTYAAGRFEVENCDPDGKRCTAAIRLCPSAIAGAALAHEGRLTDEFIPFKGLGKEERYAEVLGHELVHAVCILEDSHYAGISKELQRQGQELHLFLRQKGKGRLYEQEKQERIARLRSLANEIERPAEVAEAEIWRELSQGQSAKLGAMRLAKTRHISSRDSSLGDSGECPSLIQDGQMLNPWCEK
mgnify:CR=1 FL=1